MRKALTRQKGLDSAHITVLAHNGAETLSGSVPDASQNPPAEGAVQDIPGAKLVKSTMNVKEPWTKCREYFQQKRDERFDRQVVAPTLGPKRVEMEQTSSPCRT